MVEHDSWEKKENLEKEKENKIENEIKENK